MLRDLTLDISIYPLVSAKLQDWTSLPCSSVMGFHSCMQVYAWGSGPQPWKVAPSTGKFKQANPGKMELTEHHQARTLHPKYLFSSPQIHQNK